MDINRMTDDELAKELDRHFDVEPEQLIEVAQFIHRCVRDSQKELVEALNYFLLRSMDSGLGGLNGENLQMIRRKMEQALASVEGKDSHVA